MHAASVRQVQAAEPNASTWLSANAGSGKTRVLTDRVARLLLQGVQPQNILCLTYTKAAASEMQNRLFQRLGAWAVKPADKLRAELAELGVHDVHNAERLAEARRLFARAIETPGGLRIQTIHSYCAALLRRFPLEAGVTPNFTEMDHQSATLLRDQVIETLAEQTPEVLDDLAKHLSGDDLSPLVFGLLSHRKALQTAIGRGEALDWFGLCRDATPESIRAAAFTGGEAGLAVAIQTLCATQSATYQRFGDTLAGLNLSAPEPDDFDALCQLFLYKSGAKAGQSKSNNFPQANHSKAIDALRPVLTDLHVFMDRIAQAAENLKGLRAAEKTLALHNFAVSFLPAYDAAKQVRGWLDFDDLILKTADLLSNELVAQWVLYRLDGGLDHILVDEAQDTSPVQWLVIERLAQEFTAGLGARDDVTRTIFVVGDKKQSIYSFQGADPREFDRMRDHFKDRLVGSDAPLRAMELEYSFRSSPAILRFVDQTVDIDPISHLGYWQDLPGRVDVWPAVPKTLEPERARWYDPVDIVADDHHTAVLARELAAFMKQTIGVETVPLPNGERRLVSASDFLILVRRRSELFEAIIRACKAFGLPVAGADRLKLGAELAVKDLTAVLAFLSMPEDDLSLAAALKSPLFGWTEQQLYSLAAHRGEKYLWQVLRTQAPEHAATYEVLKDLRDQADYLRPYELIERILTRHDGRRKLLARLGAEAEDGIDSLLMQALSYEQMDVPSLTGFQSWLETGDVEVKRQLDNVGDLIRVMTVHGAKGLEAPIVILPDTAKRVNSSREQLLTLAPEQVVWRLPSNEQPDTMKNALARDKDAHAEEEERLFYVAATRAETWLIFAGAGEVGEGNDSWYSKALTGVQSIGSTPLPTPLGHGHRYSVGRWDQGELEPRKTPIESDEKLPSWAWKKCTAPDRPIEPKSPSDLGGSKSLAGLEGANQDRAMEIGSMLHRLLEFGPEIMKEGLAMVILDAEFPNAPQKEVMRVAKWLFDMPHLSEIFAPETLSEVGITASVAGIGRLSGVIDKLIVKTDSVMAIDFKTNAVEPALPSDVPIGLLRQMAAYQKMLEEIYPDRTIMVAILWTTSGNLMPLPNDILSTSLRELATS